MSIYFISDLHLSDRQPALNALFTHFITNILQPQDILYILGDWFEYWIGEDQDSSTQNLIIGLMRSLKEREIAWYFLGGNRDFLLNKSIIEKYHGHALADFHTIMLDNQKILLLHGDTLCTDDMAYQQWRQKVQKKWLQKLFLWLPLKTRKKIANRMREESQNQSLRLTEAMMDVNKNAVLKTFQTFDVSMMIHGHVHKPGVHFYWDEQKQRWLRRYVLADWDQMGNFLRYENNKFDLECFRL